MFIRCRPSAFTPFQASFCPIKRNPVPRMIGIGGERIVYKRTIRIGYKRCMLVVCVDIMTIDAIVTNVSVIMLIVGIHLTEMIIRIDIPVVLTLLSIWTSSAIGGAKRPAGSEHFKRILSIYFNRV